MTRFNAWCARSGRFKGQRNRPLVLERLEERCLLALYSITNLGTISGDSAATAINDLGDIAGWSVNSSGKKHAVLWDNATSHSLTDLQTLTGGTTSSASGINHSETVVGDADDSFGNTHAFLYDGTMHDLGTLIGMGQLSERSDATGINDAGDVAGKSNYSGGGTADFYGFWYHTDIHGTSTINPLYGSNNADSYANAIDNSSSPILVGASSGYPDPQCTNPPPTGPDYKHAYSWIATNPNNISQNEVGSLSGGEEAHAFGINAGGVVVGDSAVGHSCVAMPTPHAFVAVPNSQNPPTYTFTQLDSGVTGIAQSRAFGINGDATSYKVVAQYDASSTPPGSFQDGFLWDSSTSQAQKLTDLISPNTVWSGLLPYAINSSGDIVGEGTYTVGGSV
jgi:probable HAF family extracellular repeat protein